jgi:mannose-1-phosphate guanylyltransferase
MISIIQAGGKGTRLQPYTFALPKPLMPLGDLPIIEVLLKWLRRWGVKKTYITLGHLGHLIQAVCNSGERWGMEIKYSRETEPLGTIGALSLLRDQLKETFLTINGDIVCDLNLHDFISFHKSHGGDITVGVTERKVKIDFGVLEGQDHWMTGFREKPEKHYTVSMGIYCMEPRILELIPANVPFGFDDLMYAMLQAKAPVYMYRHNGLWLDIGNESALQQVQRNFLKDYKTKILGC